MISELVAEHLCALRADLAYHQARVLLLVTAVSQAEGHNRKLDGLTKLAKLDFLTRYPALAPIVLSDVDPADHHLHLDPTSVLAATDVEAPMTRYKFGPWDDRYYPIIGALVGKNLLRYVKGRRGSVALAPTPAGKRVAAEIARLPEWSATNDRCLVIAQGSAGLSGSALKDRIYRELPDLMNRPHRELIR